MKKIYILIMLILVMICVPTTYAYAQSITYVNDPNAKVSVDKGRTVNIYANESLDEIIYTLDRTTKVYVVSKTPDVAHITFVDGKRQVIDGYVSAGVIKSLGLNSGEIVAIVLASISAATLVGLTTFFIIYNKRKNKE